MHAEAQGSSAVTLYAIIDHVHVYHVTVLPFALFTQTLLTI